MGDVGKEALQLVISEAEEAVDFFHRGTHSANRWSNILRAVPIIAGVFSAILSVLAGSLKSPDGESNVNLTIFFGVTAAVLTALTSASASVLSGFKISNWYKVRSEGFAQATNILSRARFALKTCASDAEAIAEAKALLLELGQIRTKQQEQMAITMAGNDGSPPLAAPNVATEPQPNPNLEPEASTESQPDNNASNPAG